ncbi:unnamed protein product [Phaedon cochleariae]|uniref:Uncharacterized protein n=1 Tax=Phaedon cochleariae TaxID=80249 RepID=A0A9N9SJ99_PHACE|nr:unnamed protein product [Phaedon cochleariae]
MPQGKLRVKSKLPENLKLKKTKGNAVTKRSNRPIQPKKKHHQETQKIKQIISKSVNKAAEDELRARASGGQKNLSKAQQVIAQHNSK